MHEYSIVQELVERLLKEVERRGATSVKEIHLRRGSTFAEGPLQQAFLIMSENTPLQDAQLIIEEFSVEYKCKACGYDQVITADDLIGHLYVCPECGEAAEIEEAHGLELVSVVY
jgi:hydrogenase nickel insertion protein HypA